MTNGETTVAGLLARARDGDREALDRLFGACRGYVRVLARARLESWLQSKVDPSDLVQQSMLDAFRGFGQFQGVTSAEWLAWLRRIVEHNAADLVRFYHGADKRQVGREVALGEGSDGGVSPAAGGETPSQELLRKERELLLADALERLGDDHRAVLVLRNLQRLPFDEVARRLGRSRPAAQMLWMRAMRKLQEVMVEEGSGVREGSLRLE
jgi:RNA polymerase sigma-70 factor (ECF subfamily)